MDCDSNTTSTFTARSTSSLNWKDLLYINQHHLLVCLFLPFLFCEILAVESHFYIATVSQVSESPITENSCAQESRYALKSSNLFAMLRMFRYKIENSVPEESLIICLKVPSSC